MRPGDAGLHFVLERLRKILAMNRVIIELNVKMPAAVWILRVGFVAVNKGLPGPRFAYEYDAIAGFPLSDGYLERPLNLFPMIVRF